MNDIPGLRLAPARMIALVEQSGQKSGSASPKPSPTERQTAESSGPHAFAGQRPDAREGLPDSAATEPATKARVARSSSSDRVYQREGLEHADSVPEGELSFGDFLDIINPLQHIPIIGTIYRAITGDEIAAFARIFGGFLFGGPLGFVTATANVIADEVSGQDLGETVLAAIFDDDKTQDVQIAESGSAAKATPKSTEGTAISKNATAQPQDQAARFIMETVEPDAVGVPQPALTGPAALDAFVRDLKGIERVARNAPSSGSRSQAETPRAPSLPNTGRLQSAARQANDAAPDAARRESPDLAIANQLGASGPRASARAQTAGPNTLSAFQPESDLLPDNPSALVTIRARASDAVPADPRTLGVALPGTAFAERMFHGLEKYQVLAREGERNGRNRALLLDARL